jgi:hypothetical protein
MEFYLAENKWIIQESLLYIEDGSYWRIPNCTGLSLDEDPVRAQRWVSYIDERTAPNKSQPIPAGWQKLSSQTR